MSKGDSASNTAARDTEMSEADFEDQKFLVGWLIYWHAKFCCWLIPLGHRHTFLVKFLELVKSSSFYLSFQLISCISSH